MNKYKIVSFKAGTNGYLNIVAEGNKKFPIPIPSSCAHMLRRGMIVRTFDNLAGRPIACSFGNVIVLGKHPRSKVEIRKFLNEFKDVSSLSLDSLVFKYKLGRSLRKMGFKGTKNPVVNMQMYNYVNDLGR